MHPEGPQSTRPRPSGCSYPMARASKASALNKPRHRRAQGAPGQVQAGLGLTEDRDDGGFGGWRCRAGSRPRSGGAHRNRVWFLSTSSVARRWSPRPRRRPSGRSLSPHSRCQRLHIREPGTASARVARSARTSCSCLPQDAPQVLLSEDDDVVQAFPPKGPNHALAVRTLPRGTRRGEDLFDSQRMRSTNEGCAIDLVPVSGFTRSWACCQSDHRPQSATQNARSASVSLGRLVVRIRVASLTRRMETSMIAHSTRF